MPLGTRAILRDEDSARRDLRRTDARRPERTDAARRRTACRGPTWPNRCSSTRSSAPSTSATRAAFQEWMQEGAVGDRRPGRRLLDRVRRARPDPLRIRPALPRPRHAAARRAAAVPQRRRRPSARCAAAKGSSASLIRNSNAVFQTTAARNRDIEALFRAFPTFEDEQRLTFDRLKDFALNADPLMRQLVPAAEAALADPDRLLAPRAAGQGLLRRARTGDRPRPARAPRAAQVLPRRLPRPAARGRPVPAQPQPDPHRPRPLQERGHLAARQRRRGHQRRPPQLRRANRSTSCACWRRSGRKRWRPTLTA